MQSERNAPHRTDAKRGYRTRVATGVFLRAGRYSVSFADPTTGRERLKALPVGTNLTQAKAAREQFRVSVRTGEIVVGQRMTVSELAASFFERESGALGARSNRTIDLYRQRVNHHLLPSLGRMQVGDVRAQHLRRLVDQLVQRGLSGSTVRGTITAASAVFRHGVRDIGVIGRNPTRDLERGDLPSAKRQTEPRYLSVVQVERLLDRMTDNFRPVAAVCFWGAARVSEALALRWQHVDFEAGTLCIPGTKTAGSEATVPLLPTLQRELSAHRDRQGRKSFACIRPDELLFQTQTGKSPGRRNALRAVQKAAVAAGLVQDGEQPVGAHDLRHSLAANAFALGLSAPEVAALLRHSNPRVTLGFYAGLMEGDVATKLGERLAAGGFGS